MLVICKVCLQYKVNFTTSELFSGTDFNLSLRRILSLPNSSLHFPICSYSSFCSTNREGERYLSTLLFLFLPASPVPHSWNCHRSIPDTGHPGTCSYRSRVLGKITFPMDSGTLRTVLALSQVEGWEQKQNEKEERE